MTPRQAQVHDVIARRQPVSIGDIAVELEISKGTVEQHLHVLRNQGYIRHVGRSKAARWVLVPKPIAHPVGPLDQVPSVWHYAARCAARCARIAA